MNALFTIFVALFCLTACNTVTNKSEEKTNRTLSKYTFIDISKGSTKKYMCEIDTRIMECMGDLDMMSCRKSIDAAYPTCSERLISIMPDVLKSKDEAKKYGSELVSCITFNVMNERNIDFNELNSCIASKPKKL